MFESYIRQSRMNATKFAMERKAEGLTLEQCKKDWFQHSAVDSLWHVPEFYKFTQKCYKEDYPSIDQVYKAE